VHSSGGVPADARNLVDGRRPSRRSARSSPRAANIGALPGKGPLQSITKLGKFEIQARLGQGGMGTVYRARDPVLDRLVALKTVAQGMLAEGDALPRFRREAQAAARLQHPSIVTIYELGEVEGVFYIAMELLEGMDLSEAMVPAGRLSLEQKLRLMAEVCRGLDYAHRRGVVHRDIKPANIRLLPAGGVKIVDFGIARVGDSNLTQTGLVLGTPSYLAPEVLAGRPVDHRTDIWSVGIVLYELMAGKRPFQGPTFASLAYNIVNEPLPPLDAAALEVPAAVQQILAHALNKNPARRFPNIAEMAEGLEGAAGRKGDSGAHDTTALRYRDEAFGLTPPTGSAMNLPLVTLETPTPFRTAAQPRGGSAFRELATFGEPPASQTAALSPVRDVLVTAGADGAIRFWDLQARSREATLRTELHQRTGHDARALCVAFSSDGALLASGHVDGAVHLWDVAQRQEIPVRLKHEAMVGALAFSPDGAMLASGGMDSNLKLWDVGAALAGEARRELHRQPSGVTALAYAAGGASILSGHANRVLRLADAATGRLQATLRGPEAQINLLWSAPDGRRVAAASHDRMIRIYDLEARQLDVVLEGLRRPATSLCFFPDGARLAAVGLESSILMWDVPPGDAAPRSPATTLWGQAQDTFAAVVLYGDGDHMAAALADGRIRLWGPA
jgi:serine/threonine protein kinase